MPRGFLALDRIYAEAVRLGSEEAETSLAISADACVEHFPRTERERSAAAAILTKGEQAARRAIARRDDDALAHYALGSILYSGGHTANALAAFTDATTRDATMGWALLFRAHCLHDLKEWDEAVLAYDAVKASSFEGVIAWRYDLAREQRAFCLLMAGRRGAAIAAFEMILARYEREPHLFRDFHDDLMAAADGALAPELGTRVAALLALRR